MLEQRDGRGQDARAPRIGSVSVVVPMRDEREHIPAFVASLASQDLGDELEIIVADGGSTDGSAELIEEHARAAGLDLTVIATAAGSVSRGLNACIGMATGDLIVRMDCHSTYPADYLRRCARAAAETGAWNVGGVVEPRGSTAMERAVAAAMDSPFGGIGWTRHGATTERIDVDTVTFGAFSAHVFRHVGLFDEELVRNQDDELNLRIRLAGGRIVLDPSIRVSYTPRGSLRGVFRQYHGYGFWKVPVMLKHRRVLSARSLAPLGLVLSAGGLAVLSPLFGPARRLLAIEGAAYASLIIGFGAAATLRRGEGRLFPRAVTVFPAFHLGYGLGMVQGWLHTRHAGRT
jgi:glycosyltransferase involved in cell wall biosynthesis